MKHSLSPTPVQHRFVMSMTAINPFSRLAERAQTLVTRAVATSVFCASFAAPAATCPPNLPPSATPDSAYTVNADDTVIHIATGLMFKRCNEGRSGVNCATGSTTLNIWPGALTASRNSTFAGYSDWRLPNLQELRVLLNDSCHTPSINDTVFPNTASSPTWSSTTYTQAGNASAWIVDFSDGQSSPLDKNTGNYAVRLVRAGGVFDAVPTRILNIDDSDTGSRYQPATDGILLLRYLLGYRGAALIATARGISPQRDATAVELHIQRYIDSKAFDVDGDNQVLALTDGLMIVRRLLGLSGTALTAGAKQGSRTDDEVRDAIDLLKP